MTNISDKDEVGRSNRLGPIDKSAGKTACFSDSKPSSEETTSGQNRPELSQTKTKRGVVNGVAICLQCGTEFRVKPSMLQRGRGRFCKRSCVNEWQKTHPTAIVYSFTPPSTHAERIRAQGLINKRLKLGFIERPTHCTHCGKQARTDAHHPDYSKPDLVAFLCRSCHMRSHRDRAFEQAVALSAQRLLRKAVAS